LGSAEDDYEFDILSRVFLHLIGYLLFVNHVTVKSVKAVFLVPIRINPERTNTLDLKLIIVDLTELKVLGSRFDVIPNKCILERGVVKVDVLLNHVFVKHFTSISIIHHVTIALLALFRVIQCRTIQIGMTRTIG
jgi:hypothetical protein